MTYSYLQKTLPTFSYPHSLLSQLLYLIILCIIHICQCSYHHFSYKYRLYYLYLCFFHILIFDIHLSLHTAHPVRQNSGIFPLHRATHKKESCLQDSPPAAGRSSDILPLRRSAIIAFYHMEFEGLSYKDSGVKRSSRQCRLADCTKKYCASGFCTMERRL